MVNWYFKLLYFVRKRKHGRWLIQNNLIFSTKRRFKLFQGSREPACYAVKRLCFIAHFPSTFIQPCTKSLDVIKRTVLYVILFDLSGGLTSKRNVIRGGEHIKEKKIIKKGILRSPFFRKYALNGLLLYIQKFCSIEYVFSICLERGYCLVHQRNGFEFWGIRRRESSRKLTLLLRAISQKQA